MSLILSVVAMKTLMISFIKRLVSMMDNYWGKHISLYNKEYVLHFYEKNGFKFLYSTESLEKEANHIPEDEHLESRMMYLDLLGYIR